MSGFSLIGVNLSGAEYDPGGTIEGTNYTYPSDAEIDYYASKGMTVIRLPFLLERVEPVAGGPLSTTELGYIDNVVNYAASKGIDVILDPHDYGDEYGTVIGTTAASNATFANFWGELAAHFASTPNVLFGLMNEPNAVTPTQWLASANAAIAAIRAAGATTQQILVPGTDWDGADTWISSGNAQVLGSGIVDPSNNFASEVHQYLDSDGSGTSSTVVSTEIGVERLTAITQWAEATGNKLFLGEFGVASDPTSLTAMNNMLAYMAQHTDVWEGGTYWAAGPWLDNYMYSTEPTNGVDAPQIGVLEQYVQTTIETSGSTSLTEFGGHYSLINAAGTDPELEYAGAPVVAGTLGGWTPIGAEQTATKSR
jgi:endoglucanase